MILGVDTGGTFTDFTLINTNLSSELVLTTYKVLSTPDAPEEAILQGIYEMGLAQLIQAGKLKIIHGSTVATNALLEGKGVKTAFITNTGFKDLLSIARQTRPKLYQLQSPPIPEPVPETLCLELNCRIDSNGKILEPIQASDMEKLVNQLERLRPEAIAICFLFSFLNNEHETALQAYLQQHLSWRPFICISSYVLPEYREYERAIATWINASLGPFMENYILRLKAGTAPSPLSIMQSSGGTIDALQAAQKSVNLLLSGPAGGIAAANAIAQALNQPTLMTFDMGGTSTDVALIEGKLKLTNEGKVGRYPVAVPMVDMHTIGAGGGSVAYVDAGGLLQVGPTSAGATPGPACYGLGGSLATVTDANLVLGRLPSTIVMAKSIALDLSAARTAIATIAESLSVSIEQAAAGIILIANEHMSQALRSISTERGYDPVNYRLCCFGGAGGLHVCALASSLSMSRAIVPVNAGVLSALGMILAPIERQLVSPYQRSLEQAQQDEIDALLTQLQKTGLEQLHGEQVETLKPDYYVSADLRYIGQSSWLNIPFTTLASLEMQFHTAHKARYGHALSNSIEIVNFRVTLSINNKIQALITLPETPPANPVTTVNVYDTHLNVPVYQRQSLAAKQHIPGPAIICEAHSTTYIEPDWEALIDDYGNIMLTHLDYQN